MILNFLYVCLSGSWHISLLKLGSYRDISSSVWDISLKFFGGIPWMFVHLFQIILNFLYVWEFDSWLISLLKLDKYRDSSSSRWYIFQTFLDPFLRYSYTSSKQLWISNLIFKYICTSWIKLVTSLHYCLSCGSPSETSGLVFKCANYWNPKD